MIDVASLGSIIDGAGALPHHELHGYIPEPAESHHLFGAAFLFIGVLLIVETLAGSVWHRNRLRTTLWPAAIMSLGAGMVVVTALEPNDRLIHFTIGIIMLAAGWFEYRHRMGEVSRRTADLLIVPALIAGALEIGVFHFHGSFNNFGSVHVLMGVTAAMMALVRVYQSRLLTSPPRHAFMGVMVIALAFELMALSH
ncbi:MAG: hypothetical protein IH797_04685 [Chloroflexi bacterium]|nr:hypothetical protein [Chloroflexota bacterium]